MSAPTVIRSTAGFRSLQLFELSTTGVTGLPIGAKTLERLVPFDVTAGVPVATPDTPVSAGTTVAGPVGYYGVLVTGAKVLTINDPAPRVIPHIGDDGVFSLQVLPALEAVTGELRTDKTDDTVDAIVGAINKTTVGEANLIGQGTSKRGFENQVGALAYSAAQDTDPNSATFGSNLWDFRIAPKALVFARDTGYQQEANERMYTFQPTFVTAHLWGVQFSAVTEGYTRAQLIRGVSQYKPVICGFVGDGTSVAFPFDSARPAAAAGKVVVWVDGVLKTSGVTASAYGLVFTVAPALAAVITVFYEVA
jgi:hypothetical protein